MTYRMQALGLVDGHHLHGPPAPGREARVRCESPGQPARRANPPGRRPRPSRQVGQVGEGERRPDSAGPPSSTQTPSTTSGRGEPAETGPPEKSAASGPGEPPSALRARSGSLTARATSRRASPMFEPVRQRQTAPGRPKTVSQASRSPACTRARVSASKSSATGRPPPGRWRGLERLAAARSAATMSPAWLRLHRIATFGAGAPACLRRRRRNPGSLGSRLRRTARDPAPPSPPAPSALTLGANARHRAPRRSCRQDPLEHWFTQSTTGLGRAEIDRERQRLEVAGRRCRLPHVQEQPDLGLAEAVDRLHRVADQEQRAAVAGLPAGSQRRGAAVLRLGRVLELVDQHVAERASSASAVSVGMPSSPSDQCRGGDPW